jgi:tetratricopeptide (TPR) repeat protein
MSGDVASLATGMTPYVSAAVRVYGGGVLAPTQKETSDPTAQLGCSLLLLVFGPREPSEQLPQPLSDLAADPTDDDLLAAVRLAARQNLAANPSLAAQVSALLVDAARVNQQVRAERDAYTAAGNQTIINNFPADPSYTYAPGLVHRAPATLDGPVIVGDIPQEPPGFQPRLGLPADVDGTGSAAAGVRAVTGMRGAGKTQLAAAYARARLGKKWRLVAWVNAKDSGTLLAGLTAVADAVGLTDAASQRAGADTGRVVRHWLETDGDRCLVVFDNATDPDVLLPYIPAGGAALVLITSNLRSFANLGPSIAVEVFTHREAEAFLSGRTGLADPVGSAAVAAELGYLPLALAQAAAVIAGQYLSHQTYLERLRALPVGDYLTRERGQPYPHGVAETVLLSLEAVRTGSQGTTCIAAVEIMATFSAGGVRRELLWDAGKTGGLSSGDETGVPPAAVDAVLAQLVEWSLLTFSLDRQTVSAHRLVMRVVRDGLTRQGRLTEVCRAAASALYERAKVLEGSQDRPALRDIVEQVTALNSINSRDEQLVSALLRLRSWALYYLNELGDSAGQAIMLGEPLIADLEEIQGPDHPDTLNSRNSLAIAYRAAGRAAEAVPLHEQTLAVRESLLGPDHPDTLDSRNNLAIAYRAAGRAAEAIPLLEQTRAIRERVLGIHHPSTLVSQNNLAVAYQEASRAAEAARLHEQTLQAREHELGPDHPDTLQSRNNLAAAYRAAGRAAEAARLHEQTLQAREHVLGPDHPDTLQSRNNLAITYLEAGRTTEAVPLHEQTLAALERVLGHDHPHTLQSRNNLAVAYLKTGRTAEAVWLDEQTLNARERVLGLDHPDTLQSRKNLADARKILQAAESERP